MKAEDVEFYWPQIWCVSDLINRRSRLIRNPPHNHSHLLITRPTESNALECFVLDRAEESTHSAMLVSTAQYMAPAR